MSETALDRLDWRPRAPLVLRAFEQLPLGPVARGAMVGGVVFALYWVFVLAFDWFRNADGSFDWGDLSIRMELLQATMIGYVFTGMVLSVRGAVRDLEELRPWLDCTDGELDERVRTIAAFSPLGLGLMTGASLAVGVALPFTEQYFLDGRPPFGSVLVWHIARSILLAWAVGRLGYQVFFLSLRLSAVGRDWLRADLLDPTGARIFARHGLRNVAILMGFGVFLSLFYLAPYSTTTNSITALLLALTAAAAFVAPILGARGRLRAAKEAELALLRGRIARERERVLDVSEGSTGGGHLTDLLALERRVSEAHAWPIDVSTALRFVLYVGIGLASWLGSALVERALGTVLD